jgi:hypothetical protein
MVVDGDAAVVEAGETEWSKGPSEQLFVLRLAGALQRKGSPLETRKTSSGLC